MKIEIVLNPGSDNSDSLQRIYSIHKLYMAKRSLAEVGREIGLSRERIRQLLEKGERLGLFKYKGLYGTIDLRVTKKKILEDYEKTLQLGKVAERNGLSIYGLNRLISHYHITSKRLSTIRLKIRKERCFIEYRALVDSLNHKTGRMNLRQSEIPRKFYSKIIRLWPSFSGFQRDFKKVGVTGKCRMTETGKQEGERNMKTEFVIWLRDERRPLSKYGKRLSFEKKEDAEKTMKDLGILDAEIQEMKMS